MHIAVLVFYAVDALLLTLFAWLEVIPWHAGWSYGVAGESFVLSQIAIFRRGSRDRQSLNWNTIVLTLGAAGLMLMASLVAPAIGGFMLMSMMTVLAATALQLNPRHLGVVYLACVLGAAATILGTHTSVQWPTETLAERALTTVWFAWLLGKCAAINIAGTQLRHLVRQANLELASALLKVEEAASTDELTVLPNRRSILSKLNDAVIAVHARCGFVGVALFDIDHFKTVNDRYGHAVGDEVLREFGSLIAGNLRPDDWIGRYGGEEFLLVLRDIGDHRSALEATDRLRRVVEQHEWGHVADGLLVTASAGVAMISAEERGSAAIGRADAALYLAKAGGRNQVVVA